jgi:arsenite-transporting ATPase
VHDVLSAPLSLFTGKGGVGKSTVVAAVAIEAARRGRSPLIVELGHRSSMASIFGVHVAHDPALVAPNVHAIDVELERALSDYVRAHVPGRVIARRIAGSATLARFFRAAPAVPELLTLWHLEALLAAGRFAPILVDLEATGHATMFLELPHVFEGLAARGPVRRLLDSFAALLSDASRTRLHLVTMPGRLPVEETIELVQLLRRDHHVALGTLFVNQVPDAPLPEGSEARLRALTHPIVADDVALALGAAAEHRAMLTELRRLDALALPTVTLPRLRSPIDARALAILGRSVIA